MADNADRPEQYEYSNCQESQASSRWEVLQKLLGKDVFCRKALPECLDEAGLARAGSLEGNAQRIRETFLDYFAGRGRTLSVRYRWEF